ncbi:MAG: hypothetical protein H7338_10860 [Candidatus Sericytochromatia bacterium]|nr:hypothetical protein [Candidatus Sericytochromatia bacterium]
MDRRTFMTEALRFGAIAALPRLFRSQPAFARLASDPTAAAAPAVHPHVLLVKRFQESFATQQTDAIRRDLLVQNVVWHQSGHRVHATDKPGAEELLTRYGQLIKDHSRDDVRMFRTAGNQVLDVRRKQQVKGQVSNERLLIVVYTVQNGRIAAMNNFTLDHRGTNVLFNRLQP